MSRRTVFQVRNMLGETVAEHVRVEWPGGHKRMYWQMPGHDPRDGLVGLSTPDLPLYGSERIPSFRIGQTVVVAEGEKATEAVWVAGIDALGTVTGTSTAPGEDALSVLLSFDVVLWPDHDRVGYQHMNRIAWALYRLGGHLPRFVGAVHRLAGGASLHTIAPKGFDAADAVSRDALYELVDDATPWDLHEDAPRPRLLRPVYDRAADNDRVQSARAHLLSVVEGRLGPPKAVKQGTPWWCCPFHGEQTPSFKVSVSEPYYRCFGCGARGDVFTFLREIEGRSFKESLSELAPAVGIGGIPRLWG